MQVKKQFTVAYGRWTAEILDIFMDRYKYEGVGFGNAAAFVCYLRNDVPLEIPPRLFLFLDLGNHYRRMGCSNVGNPRRPCSTSSCSDSSSKMERRRQSPGPDVSGR